MKKHGGGPVLLRECFAVAESENVDCMKYIMDSLKYQAKNLDAFDAETAAWWSIDFSAGHSSQYIQMALFRDRS